MNWPITASGRGLISLEFRPDHPPTTGKTALRNSDPDRLLRHHRREQGLMFALASPALLVIVLLVVLPVGWLAWQSVYHDGFTLENYRRILNEDIYWRSFLLTFEISLLVTLLALLLGYPIAFAASSVSKGWSIFILALVILPFWTSVLVRAYAWLTLLQRTGVINRFLQFIGAVDEPLALAHNTFGTVVATLHILLPFMVLPLYVTMQKIPHDLMQAGASLGGSPLHNFWRIFLPLSLPGVLAGTTLVFVLSLGFYITPELLGGGRTIMVSMLVSRNVELYDQWGAASAVGVVLLVFVFAIFLLVSRFISLDRIVGQK
jgi:putative spermidine/putrescine transport system permease protein